MSKKDTRKLLAHARKHGKTEVEKLKAELDMAVGLIIAQKMLIARLRYKLKKHKISEDWDVEDMKEMQ